MLTVGARQGRLRITSPANDPGKQRRQNAILEAIGTLPDTRIVYGHYLPKAQTCFQCGATWNAHDEKMTNDNIAVEMLKDAFDDTFDTAPVEAVRSCFPAKRVESAAFLAI